MNEFARQVMMWVFLLVVCFLLVKAVREDALRSRDVEVLKLHIEVERRNTYAMELARRAAAGDSTVFICEGRRHRVVQSPTDCGEEDRVLEFSIETEYMEDGARETVRIRYP